MKNNQLFKSVLIIVLIVLQKNSIAQIGINADGSAPSSNSMLDVKSTSKGVMLPRIADPASIPTPTDGLLFYNTTAKKFNYYDGMAWQQAFFGNQWNVNGSNISYSGGNVGIGISNPTSLLHLGGNLAFTPNESKLISVNDNTIPGNGFGSSLTIRAASPYQGVTGNRGGSLFLQAGNGWNTTGYPYSGGDVFLRSGGNILNAFTGVGNGANIVFQTGGANNANNENWTEQMRINPFGNVGIGISSPTATLDVARGSANTGTALFRGTNFNSFFNGDMSEDTYIRGGKPTSNVILADVGSGKVGIGTVLPGFPLSFTNALGDKIALWGSTGNHYGFGIQGSLLQIHTDGAGADIAFGHGTSASMTETMRIKGNGNVGIGVNPIFRLDVNGSIRLTNTENSSGGNIGIGIGSFSNAKLYIKSNQQFGLLIDAPTSPEGYALAVSGSATISGNLSKGGGSFKIDHPLDPENKYLYHSFVESPDMMNVYNGNIKTDGSGLATVILPDYFEALNKDFRYQLTVIGTFAQAIVLEEVKGNQFVIKTDKPNIKVSWQVTGTRQDAYANKNRIPVSENKKTIEKGTYLHPDAFGVSESKNVMKVQMKSAEQ